MNRRYGHANNNGENDRQDTRGDGANKGKYNTEEAKVDPTKNVHNSQTVAQLGLYTNFQRTKTKTPYNRRYSHRSTICTNANTMAKATGDTRGVMRQTGKYNIYRAQVHLTKNKFTLTIHRLLHNFTQTFSTQKRQIITEIPRRSESIHTRERVAHSRWRRCAVSILPLGETTTRLLVSDV